MSKDKGTPEHGKQYCLVGGKDTKSIAKGNTWAESEVKPDPEDDPAVKLLKAACRKEHVKLKLDTDAPKVEIEVEPHPPFAEVPFTEEQTAAITNLYMRASDGAANLEEFKGRFNHCIGGYVGGQWCNMHIGIESDGHTHS